MSSSAEAPTLLKAAQAGLTRQQLCAALAVSESTVRRLEREGLPLVSDAPRGKRYDLAAVKVWLRASQHFHPAKAADPAPAAKQPIAWDNLPEAAARYFYGPTGKPQPMAPRPPPPKLTAHERRKQRQEAERQKQEARRALVTFHANKRRSARILRTPPWADMDAMRAIYAEAQRLAAETGIPHHVDHVIPLQGKLVSGLHVENNLQILTGPENSRKRNHFEVEP